MRLSSRRLKVTWLGAGALRAGVPPVDWLGSISPGPNMRRLLWSASTANMIALHRLYGKGRIRRDFRDIRAQTAACHHELVKRPLENAQFRSIARHSGRR